MPNLPDPISLIFLVGILGLLPFLVIMTTSFVKLVVVFSLIRNALGVQQIPPNLVLNGLALILTLYIMAPVGTSVFESLQQIDLKTIDTPGLIDAASKASEPFRTFLSKHSAEGERLFFIETAQRLWPPEMRDSAASENLLILIPAFTLSELKSAFEIGFLLYLPFIAIDLIISNILLAMGMMMVSPMTISLPFKLLLFVMLDGWTQLIQGLVLTYQ